MIITQFDTDPVLSNIRDRHHAWHSFPGGTHGFPSRSIQQGLPGSGNEFLSFHRNLMNEFFTWNNVHGAVNATLLAAWNAIPPVLKTTALGWTTGLQNAENRINTNIPSFANADALGIHIETTIHNWIHGAVGGSSLPMDPGESPIISGFHSVQSTYFYQIHGLVQFWWDQWLSRRGIITKRIVDSVTHKLLIKENLKEHLKDTKDSIFEGKPIKEFKEKDKDIFEQPKFMVETVDIREINDPVFMKLNEKIAELEKIVKGKAFIKSEERPDVGKQKQKSNNS